MLEKIDRYKIIKELGRGGMATVYLATDPRFQRQVAIKVLPSQFLHDPQFRARFRREAQTIAALEHPAIVPVYDFGEEGQPFIVMRYMSGGSLEERIKAGEIPLSAAIRIVNRIADALDSAHQRNVIHRDLKPANILFDQYDNAHLSDFGIVKVAEQSAGFTGNNIIGTAAYMSPEQAQGGADIDGRSDIYALGVVLFEMLSNEMPFGGDTPIQQLMGHITRPIPAILDRNPNLPPAIEPIIQRALAKSPDDRYSKAQELARALTNVMNAPRQSPPTMLDNQTLIDIAPPPAKKADPLITQFEDPAPQDEPSSNLTLWETSADSTTWDAPPSQPTMAEPATVADTGMPRTYTPHTSAPPTKKRGFLWLGIAGMLALFALLAGAYYFLGGLDNGTTVEPTETAIAEIVDVVTETPTDEPVTETPPTETPEPVTDVPPTETPEPLPTPAFVVAGAFGGGGSRIAFQSQQGGGTWTIWTMDLDGRDRVQLTDDSGNDIRPRWSPDGEWITFTSDRDGGEDMWMVRPDGTELQKLTTNPLADFTGAWSPDGEWLAYHADLDGMASILKVRADGSETMRLTTEADGHSFWPSWSPDGERLVFWTIRNEDKPEIWTMDSTGGNQTALVTGSGTYLDPVWSPVSNDVAYYAYDGGSAEIFTVNANGGTPTQVQTSLPASTILGDWSPDGEWMVLHTDWHGADEIYRVRVDGSEGKRLTNAGSDDQHAAWQPNGREQVALPQVITGEITIWHAFPGTDGETLEASFRTFEELYPELDVTARFVDQADAREEFENATERPDLFLAPIDWGGSFVADGLVQQPTEFMSASVLRTLDPLALQNAQYAGQMVGLPFAAKGIVLFTNKAVVPEAPRTVKAILQGSGPFNLERGLYYSGATLQAQGGQLMDAEGNPLFNDLAGQRWIELLAEFNDDQAYGDGDIEAFVRGEVGVILDATWNIRRLVNSIGASNLAIEPFPDGMAGWVLYDVAYVSADADNEPAVSAFLEHLVSAEIQTVLAESGRVPVTDNATVTDPFVEQAAAILATNEPFPIAPEMSAYWTPLTIAIEAVAVDGANSADALNTAAQAVREALNR